MARRLTHRQLGALSKSIKALYQIRQLDDFPRQVFRAVTSLVPCDYVAYNEFGPDGLLRLLHCEPELPAASTNFLLSLGEQFTQEHPGVEYVTRTGSTEPLKITDFTTQRKWQRTTLYNEFFHPLECEYQIGFASPVPSGQIGLGFNCALRDYTEDDRRLLELLRPHITQAHANAQAFTRIGDALHALGAACVVVESDGRIACATGRALPWVRKYFGLTREPTHIPPEIRYWLLKPAGIQRIAQPLELLHESGRLTVRLARRDGCAAATLVLEETDDTTAIARLAPAGMTSREAEILLWLTRGKSTAEIAVILRCKPATVSKHLEHIYQKLGVESRNAAATAALEMLRAAQGGESTSIAAKPADAPSSDI